MIVVGRDGYEAGVGHLGVPGSELRLPFGDRGLKASVPGIDTPSSLGAAGGVGVELDRVAIDSAPRC